MEPTSAALAGGFFTAEPLGKPSIYNWSNLGCACSPGSCRMDHLVFRTVLQGLRIHTLTSSLCLVCDGISSNLCCLASLWSSQPSPESGGVLWAFQWWGWGSPRVTRVTTRGKATCMAVLEIKEPRQAAERAMGCPGGTFMPSTSSTRTTQSRARLLPAYPDQKGRGQSWALPTPHPLAEPWRHRSDLLWRRNIFCQVW